MSTPSETVDKVITGQLLIAQVPGITPDMAAAERLRQRRRSARAMAKANRQQAADEAKVAELRTEYERGYNAAFERDRGPGMLGVVLVFASGCLFAASITVALLW